jgi:hypothetical protein
LLKLGSFNYEDLKQLTVCIEEKLFKMDAPRDKSLTYKSEEIQARTDLPRKKLLHLIFVTIMAKRLAVFS